jgi:hypothetical protein
MSSRSTIVDINEAELGPNKSQLLNSCDRHFWCRAAPHRTSRLRSSGAVSHGRPTAAVVSRPGVAFAGDVTRWRFTTIVNAPVRQVTWLRGIGQELRDWGHVYRVPVAGDSPHAGGEPHFAARGTQSSLPPPARIRPPPPCCCRSGSHSRSCRTGKILLPRQ